MRSLSNNFITHNTDKSIMTMQSNATIQTKLTSWVWVNAPVHSVPSGERSKIWDHYQTILSLITQISQSWQCRQTWLYKQNLPAEYELMHQFTAPRGKRSKIWDRYQTILSLITQISQSWQCSQTRPYKQSLPPEYELMHQFTVPRGKGAKYEIIIKQFYHS